MKIKLNYLNVNDVKAFKHFFFILKQVFANFDINIFGGEVYTNF